MDEPLKGRVNLAAANMLVIDSNPQGREILLQVIGGMGVRRMTRADDLAAAREQLRLADFDLIICSSVLSDGDGYSFVNELRRAKIEPNRFTAVILLSGHTPMGDVRRARDCGANFVIAKPISPRILLERIVWIAREERAFIEAASVYVGPDRRFQDTGPPEGMEGRRHEDQMEKSALEQTTP
jgi:CheY-like chemotaxis protein